MKRLSRLTALLLTLAMLLSLVSIAHAEEKQSATAWLLYFASNHETDSSKFPWWPQHKSADQPSSETGVEATNAEVTGPGMYTVGLKFNWQKAEGAIQFNLVLDNAESLFPGYYVKITDIRVNGKSIDHKPNLYGTFHDDPNAGFAPIYNNYWDKNFSPDSTGPDGLRAFDSADEATYEIINPDDIVAGDTIEVDFIVAANAGEMPEDIGEKPGKLTSLVAPPPVLEDGAEAWLFYQSGSWWPANTKPEGDSAGHASSTTAKITGDGYYTASLSFDRDGWSSPVNGAKKLLLVVSDGTKKLPNSYLKITDIRVNGKSINFTDVGFGAHYGDQYIQATDDYSIIYDDWMVENNSAPWNHKDWNGNVTDNVSAINPDDIKNGMTIDVDFFITSTAGKAPAKDTSSDPVWFPNNTASLAGLTLKDLGIADDWHAIVPVDLSKTGWQTFPLLAANFKQVGTAYVAVNNGSVTVTCEYNGFYVVEKSQCIKWFTSLDQISKAELVDISNGLDCGSVVSIADDLGGASMAYLSINNKITWRNPVDDFGNSLPDYWKNLPQWKEYRANLMEMINAANAE